MGVCGGDDVRLGKITKPSTDGWAGGVLGCLGEASGSRLPIAAMRQGGGDWRFSLRHRSSWRLHVYKDRLDGRPCRRALFLPKTKGGEQASIAAVNEKEAQ